MDTLSVSEVFGPTVQGEGPSAGQRATFVRLGRCNLTCVWCDTPYTWDWRGLNGHVYRPHDELTTMSVEQLRREVHRRAVPLVIITGGEPLLQQHTLAVLVRALGRHRVEIETNGTLAPQRQLTEAGVRLFVVSPKLANSGIRHDRRIVPSALRALEATRAAVLKFVICEPDDLDEADAVRALVPAMPAWAMPEGRTPDALGKRMGWLADAAIERGYNLSGRLHVTLWGDVRGR